MNLQFLSGQGIGFSLTQGLADWHTENFGAEAQSPGRGASCDDPCILQTGYGSRMIRLVIIFAIKPPIIMGVYHFDP
jgi:hypothetical protein